MEAEEAEQEEEPEYVCGYAEHEHGEGCYDETGAVICELAAHEHDENCVEAEEAEQEEEPENEPEYCCGLVAHAHGDACVDSDSDELCDLVEHEHGDACLVMLVEEPETFELTLTPDEDGKVSFEIEFYNPGENHLAQILVLDGDTKIVDIYGMNYADTRTISFVAEHGGEYIAEITQWLNDGGTKSWRIRLLIEEKTTYFCGLEEHVHGDSCVDADGDGICDLIEHTHDALYCTAEPIVITLTADAQPLDYNAPFVPVQINANIAGGVEPYAVSIWVYDEQTESDIETMEGETSDDETVPGAQYAFSFVPQNTGAYAITVYVEDAEGRVAQAELTVDIVRNAPEWEEALAGITLTGDPAADVLAIAKTQIGYQAREADPDFGNEDPVLQYETRYGDWFEEQREEWSTLFAAFCLHYGNVTEYPTADSVQAWEQLLKSERLYRDAQSYVPQGGDLAFVDLDADGQTDRMAIVHHIVTDENGNVSDVTLIVGNYGSAVATVTTPISGGIISGFATYTESEPEVEYTPETWDVTQGPMFWITAELKPQLRQLVMLLDDAAAQADAVDLKAYLKNNGGTFNFTLTDLNNNDLMGPDGKYEVTAGLLYKLSMSINSPKGIAPGTYTYQLPVGLSVVEGTGQFKLTDGTVVGEWTVSSEGLITFEFNQNMNKYQNVTISAVMGTEFSENQEQIDFDGKIHVSVQKPVVDEEGTALAKWGEQGDESAGQDPNKIYWTVWIEGNANSQIVGETVTDTILSGNHQYTQSDRDAGLIVYAVNNNPSDGELTYHSWIEYPGEGNPNLQWTENGWTYTMPTHCLCGWHGASEPLKNDNWRYTFMYTSSPTNFGATGANEYTNKLQVDDTAGTGRVTIDFGHSGSGVVKTGAFRGDADGGKFYWQVIATIPGITEESKTTYYWNIWDQMKIINSNEEVGSLTNDMNLSTVTATNNGQVYTVPRIEAATENDPFAWSVDSDTQGNSGRLINFYCKCVCTEDSCPWWAGYCVSVHDTKSDFCRCWNVQGTTEFTFTYETDDPKIIDEFGGAGNQIYNYVYLNLEQKLPNGEWSQVTTDDAYVAVPIPGVFKKELGDEIENAIATYTITVNEAKLPLTDETSQLLIHDVMTETLTYIAGSLVITAEDQDGNVTKLTEGVDYTVTYDGTGNEKDNDGKPLHVLNVRILHPASVMYTLVYDTFINIPEGATEGVRYSNYADVTLFGNTFNSGVGGKVYTDINIAAKNYQVQVAKYDSKTNAALSGARFGLYNEDGGLVAAGTTDANGQLIFKTDIAQGIVLLEHELYYIQEIEAPDGYVLDSTKHRFFFCDEKTVCEDCEVLFDAYDGVNRIPGDTLGRIDVGNQMGADLSVTKKVSGVQTDEAFEIWVTLSGAAGEFAAEITENGQTVRTEKVHLTNAANGDTVSIMLKDGQTFTIKNLPADTIWSVTENLSESAQFDFAVAVTEGIGNVDQAGTTASGTIGMQKVEVTVTNTAKTYDLPSTGGSGTRLYTMGGWLLIAAGIFLLYNQRRYRKEGHEN